MDRGSGKDRAAALTRVTDFFLSTAGNMDDEHVGIFDMVISRLSRSIELGARIELSKRLAPLPNAPVGVVRQLALDDIAAARPVLVESSRLTNEDLVAISTAKGREHMLAITERRDLGERITDFLIARGGRMVTQAVAANQSARFSQHGMGVMVMRAIQDEVLQATLEQRTDIPTEFTEQLLRAAKISARRRLNESLAPSMVPSLAEEIDGAIDRSVEAVSSNGTLPRDLVPVSAAMIAVQALKDANQLDEAKLAAFAREGSAEHTICAIGVLAHFNLATSEQVVMGIDREAILFVARAHGWSWETTKALIWLRRDSGKSPAAIERARETFRNMSMDTAQRVSEFLRAKDAHSSEATPEPAFPRR